MFLLQFYRLYTCLLAGGLFFFFVKPWWWLALLVAIGLRVGWLLVEQALRRAEVKRLFARHRMPFKELCGPYGVRIVNKAEEDPRVMASLVEAFESNTSKLKKNVEQLEMLNTLFNAGMRPEGDEFLLHDLKLKYGKYRLE